MASKNSFNTFSLGYAISYFLIFFGNITLFGNITGKLFLIGANIQDILFYLASFTVFSFILTIVAPVLGFISDKRKLGSRRRPYLIFSIVGMALVAILFYFSPLNFGSIDFFLIILF